MKRLLFFAVVLLLFASTSNRLREERTISEAAREMGISTDTLVRRVNELNDLTHRLNELNDETEHLTVVE